MGRRLAGYTQHSGWLPPRVLVVHFFFFLQNLQAYDVANVTYAVYVRACRCLTARQRWPAGTTKSILNAVL